MTWDIYDIDGVRTLIEVGGIALPGAVLIGQTSDPDYLTPPRQRVLSRLDFRRLFTLPERVAIDGAPDNTALPATARAVARTILTDLSLAGEVNLDDPDTIQGVQFLVSIGLIAPARASEILG